MQKQNQKGFLHVKLLVGILVIAGAVGFAGWRVYKSQNTEAQAAANIYTTLSTKDLVTTKACKTFVDAGSFGKYWKVSILVTNNNNSSKGIVKHTIVPTSDGKAVNGGTTLSTAGGEKSSTGTVYAFKQDPVKKNKNFIEVTQKLGSSTNTKYYSLDDSTIGSCSSTKAK